MENRLKNMTLEAIANACGGIYYGSADDYGRTVTSVITDSRKAERGSLFIAIKGERADGHSFIRQVYDSGALCCISERELSCDECGGHAYILVTSSLQALKDIAEFYRQQLNVKVVGITGSVGKTSTKETIAAVLSQRYNVLKTAGNFNNEIGLPLTVFRITEDTEVAVLEMGISDFGEMTRLTRIARPDICVITNIGICHLENLKSRDGILKAKTEIFKSMKDGGSVVLNGDDDKLQTVNEVNGQRPYFFSIEDCDGTGSYSDVYASNINDMGLDGTDFNLHILSCMGDNSKEAAEYDVIEVHIPVPGKHMVYNAMAAAAVGRIMGLDNREIKEGIAGVETISGRNNIIHKNDMIIIDDCYNANPVSMRASIDVIAGAEGRKVCILGDMFELGEDEKRLHYEIGNYAVQKGIDVLITAGELTKELSRGAREAGSIEIHHYDTRDDMLKELSQLIRPKDNILVKASHVMQFSKVVEELCK